MESDMQPQRPPRRQDEVTDLDIARMYAAPHGGAIYEFIGLPGGNDPAALEAMQQAAADTVQYLESRPARPGAAPHPDSHYEATMGPTDSSKTARQLTEEWAHADANQDRTRARDIQVELNRRVQRWRSRPQPATAVQGHRTDTQAILESSQALEGRKRRIQASLAAAAMVPTVQQAVRPSVLPAAPPPKVEPPPKPPQPPKAPLPPRPPRSPPPGGSPRGNNATSYQLPRYPESRRTPWSAAARKAAASRRAPPVKPAPPTIPPEPVSKPHRSRLQRAHDAAAYHTGRLWLYYANPERGKRRQVVTALGIAAVSAAGGFLLGYLFGHHATPKAYYELPNPEQVPAQPPFPQPSAPHIDTHMAEGHRYIWGAYEDLHPNYSDGQVSKAILHDVATLKQYGWQVGTWANPHNPDIWGISPRIVAPHDQYLLFNDGHVEHLTGQTYTGVGGRTGALHYADAYAHAKVLSREDVAQITKTSEPK